jgi:hypothetical protein
MSIHCNDPITLLQYWFKPEAVSVQCEWALRAYVQPTHSTFIGYLKVFFETNALEAPFYFCLLRRKTVQKRLVYLFSANLLTHPAVYFLFPILFSKMNQAYGTFLTSSEVFALGAETLFVYFLAKTRFPSTAFWIVSANLFSWWVGIFLS